MKTYYDYKHRKNDVNRNIKEKYNTQYNKKEGTGKTSNTFPLLGNKNGENRYTI